jgi:hypothetical protein
MLEKMLTQDNLVIEERDKLTLELNETIRILDNLDNDEVEQIIDTISEGIAVSVEKSYSK